MNSETVPVIPSNPFQSLIDQSNDNPVRPSHTTNNQALTNQPERIANCLQRSQIEQKCGVPESAFEIRIQ
jgi:hypothetical protein